jgi:hypothetical protein
LILNGHEYYEQDPSEIPYTKYRLEADGLLKEFAKNYHKDDRAHCHSDERASETAHRISLYVRVHWRPEFMENQCPEMMRKPHKAYVQEGNN